MNIKEFLNKFNDIIPYKFQLKVGGLRSNEIEIDKELISSDNYKGKTYPIYRNNIFGMTTEYISLDKIDVPIELTIQCLYPHFLKWEKKPKSTNKKRSSFEVRILNKNNKRQLGYLSLDLTPAGDINYKFCSFGSEDGTREIIQSIFYEFDKQTKKVIASECLDFIFYNLETGLEEKVSFHRENGVLKCVTINKQALKNHAFDSIVWSDDKVKEKHEFFSRYCNNALVEKATPIACDFTNYIINKDFVYKSERIKELQRILTYEGDSRFTHYDYDKIREELEYLKNPMNDIFSSFYGEYIGNTIIKIDSKLILVVETLMDNYHYFTNVDITNTDAFDVDFYHERVDGATYYQAIENSDKTPVFRTKIENGEEILVPLGETITENELQNFEMFKSFCDENFDTIEKEKMATLSLHKYSSTNQSH